MPEERLLPFSETRVGIGRRGVGVPEFGVGQRRRQRKNGLGFERIPT